MTIFLICQALLIATLLVVLFARLEATEEAVERNKKKQVGETESVNLKISFLNKDLGILEKRHQGLVDSTRSNFDDSAQCLAMLTVELGYEFLGEETIERRIVKVSKEELKARSGK